MKYLQYALILACIAAPAAASAMIDFAVAESGLSRACIVVPRRLDPELESAVNDLVSCVKRASGADTAIVTDGAPIPGPAIHIGMTDLACRSDLPLDKLEYDGYAIAVRDGSLLICGRSDQGTTFGVYGFLHDYLGARWYAPGEMWEVVPKSDHLSVRVLNTTVNPSFPYRVWQAGWYSPLIRQWCTRNRITTYGFERMDSPFRTFNHNLATIFPVSKYGKEHPEYYAEIDGKRFIPARDDDGRGQPCFTNPDVIRITVETISRFFDEHPEATQYSVSVNDNADFCTCAQCSALDKPYAKTENGPIFSDSYFHFVKEVAERIETVHPGKTIGCLAYWRVELTPRRISRLPENVVVELTQDTSQYIDPSYAEKDRRIFREWSKLTRRLIKYDYYGLGWITPRYYPHLIADDLAFQRRNGSVGTYAEIYPYWATSAPMLCMAAELAWDIDQRPDAVLDEYFRDLYGPAAPEMSEFYSILEGVWAKERPGRWFQGLAVIDQEMELFDIAAMTHARRMLDLAASKSDGVIRRRVQSVRRDFDFSYVVESGHAAAASLKGLPLNDRSDVQRLPREILRTVRLERLAERAYESGPECDPAYILYYKPNTSYFQFGSYYKLDQWERIVNVEVLAAIERLESWAVKHLPQEEAERAISQVRTSISRIEIRQKVENRSPSAESR